MWAARRRDVTGRCGNGNEVEKSHKSPKTRVIRQRFEVAFEYEVQFTRGLFRPDNPVLRDAVTRVEPDRRHRVWFVLDSGVADAWPDLGANIRGYAQAHADAIEVVGMQVMPGGERAKQDAAHAEAVQRALQANGMDRHAFVAIVGGGAVLDAAGYAAATTHRGMRVIRVPTTVLAQNDSGVGVKNGINAFGLKNFLGTFAPPFAVLSDADFLDTLSPRDLRAGIAEAVKVALIRDRLFFEWLDGQAAALSRFEPDAMATMIARAAELHMTHIATGGDPFEMGTARPLDFGHWCAHKLESLTDHALRHGEAVAIGLALDSIYSAEVGLLSSQDAQAVVSLLARLGFRLWDDAMDRLDHDDRPAILAGVREFREHLGGELAIPMLTAIGRSTDVGELHDDVMATALGRLRERDRLRANVG